MVKQFIWCNLLDCCWRFCSQYILESMASLKYILKTILIYGNRCHWLSSLFHYTQICFHEMNIGIYIQIIVTWHQENTARYIGSFSLWFESLNIFLNSKTTQLFRNITVHHIFSYQVIMICKWHIKSIINYIQHHLSVLDLLKNAQNIIIKFLVLLIITDYYNNILINCERKSNVNL